MRSLAALLCTTALALSFAGPVNADPYADSGNLVLPDPSCLTAGGTCDVTGDDNDGGSDATGAPDHTQHSGANGTNTAWTSLGFDSNTTSGGVLTLDFTDNVCLDGEGGDLQVFEVSHGETYDVAVGLASGSPLNIASGATGDAILDANSAGGFFNRVVITALDGEGATSGADIDAVQCSYTLDQADIVKAFAANPLDNDAQDEIFVMVKGQTTIQHKAFTIEITNNTGILGGLAGLNFVDAVPAEYDLDPDAESPTGDAQDDNCADGACDGIAHELDGTPICPVVATRNQGAGKGKNANNKLEPELLSIAAGNLGDGESCTNTVYVKTEQAHKKSTTPTSCPVDLNSGVKVFDSVMNLLLVDDDKLLFVTDPVEPNEGACIEPS